jgi:hypothetical protein
MARRTRRKCRHCKRFFIPDPRNIKRQRYCREQPCRAASKAASQRRWLSKPENHDVFKGPIHVARVQDWRRAHPGYWRRPSAGGSLKGAPLQDSLITQAVDNNEESGQFVEPALQDLLNAQPTVLIGLIAQFSDSTGRHSDYKMTSPGWVRDCYGWGTMFSTGMAPPMTHKQLICPARARRLPPQFSWIDQRLDMDVPGLTRARNWLVHVQVLALEGEDD